MTGQRQFSEICSTNVPDLPHKAYAIGFVYLGWDVVEDVEYVASSHNVSLGTEKPHKTEGSYVTMS